MNLICIELDMLCEGFTSLKQSTGEITAVNCPDIGEEVEVLYHHEFWGYKLKGYPGNYFNPKCFAFKRAFKETKYLTKENLELV